jgi:hypothetical protein
LWNTRYHSKFKEAGIQMFLNNNRGSLLINRRVQQ